MSYRVYDTERKEWLKEDVYLSPNDELFLIKKTLFGNRLVELSDERYVFHKDIDLCDDKNVLIYEGDIIEARVSENRIVHGVVTYVNELSSYVILCVDSEEYFTLGNSVSEFISIIGNVFDGIGEEHNGQQSLQEEAV